MSVREDRINLIVTVNGDKGRKQLVELENEASKIRAAMRGLNKESAEYAKQAKALEAVEKQMSEIRKEIDITKLTVKELNAETRRLRQIRDNLDPASEAFRRVNGDIDKLIARTRELTNSSKGMGKELSASGNVYGEVLSGIKNALPAVGVAAAAAFATDKVVDFIGRSRELGYQVQGIEAAFKRLDTDVSLTDLRASVRGTVSDLNLMKLAVQADNFNIPLETMRVGLEFAQKQAARTGQSVDYLTDSFVTGLGRQSPLILDNLGISLTELNEAIASGADFNVAVMEVVERKLQGMGEISLGAKGRVDQLNATMDNLATTLGESLNAVIDGTIQGLAEISGEIGDELQPSFQKLQDSLHDLREASRELGDTVGVNTDKFSLLDAIVAVFNTKIQPLVQGGRLIIEVWNQVATGIGNVTSRVVDGTNAVTDFLGLTSAAERAYNRQVREAAREADEIEKQRQENRLQSIKTQEEEFAKLSAMFDKGEEQAAKTIEAELKAEEERRKIAEKASARRQKQAAEREAAEAGSIRAIQDELNALTRALDSTEISSARYLQLVDQIILKTEQLEAAELARLAAFLKAESAREGAKPIGAVAADPIKAENDLLAQMEAHGKRKEDLAAKHIADEEAKKQKTLETVGAIQDSLASLDAGFNAISAIFQRSGDDAERNLKFQKLATATGIALQNAQALAAAVAGATTAAASTGPGAPFVLAGYIASMIGIVAGTMKGIRNSLNAAEVPQYAEGGFDDGRVTVRGASDKRLYRARKARTLGGFVGEPTLTPSGSLGGERGREYWISNNMMRNPVIYRVAEMLEDYRTTRQFAAGGFDTASTTTAPAPAPRSPETDPTAMMLLDAINRLNAILERGVPAYYGDDEVQNIRKVTTQLSKAEERGAL